MRRFRNDESFLALELQLDPCKTFLVSPTQFQERSGAEYGDVASSHFLPYPSPFPICSRFVAKALVLSSFVTPYAIAVHDPPKIRALNNRDALEMARHKQSRPMQRIPSGEIMQSPYDFQGVLQKPVNGHVHQPSAKTQRTPPKPSTTARSIAFEAGYIQLIVCVAGIYASL